MIIDNLRFGFACNSSSTHSVVVVPKGTRPKDTLLDEKGDHFGWQYFVAASRNAKQAYLKTILDQSIEELHSGKGHDDIAKRLSKLMFGDTGDIGGIDHQSFPIIPKRFGTAGLNLDFFDELCKYIMRSDVVVLGGNDNENAKRDDVEWKRLNKAGKRAAWHTKNILEVRLHEWVARKEGDWWILFNQKEGTKVTLSFKDNPKPRVKAEVPELVDLKITDFCPYNCDYCYMGSTTKGGHAQDITSWLWGLEQWGVFEVAVGGGEPTLHPDFDSLLEGNREIRVNFTTRNLDWIECHKDLARKAGAIAVSVDEYHGRKGFCATADRIGKLPQELRDKIQIQYVMGTADDWAFEAILKGCSERHLRLTLLGYKLTGRGEAAKKRLERYKLQEGDGWIPLVKEANCFIAIDTALAAQVKPDTFSSYLVRTTEGTHSCYIDAITKRLHKDSYSETEGFEVGPFGGSLEKSFKGV